MKKYFLPIILSSILFACSSSPETTDDRPAQAEWNDTISPETLLDEYDDFVAEIDSNDVEAIGKATEKYEELFENSDEETCDKAFMIFDRMYENMENILNEDVMNDVALQEIVWTAYDENGKKQPIPAEYKKLENRVKPYGYRLEFPEGMISIGLDRSYIAKNFYKYVSPEMRNFLVQLDKDNNKPFSEDAGIIIDEKEFVERLIWWENFEKQNPEFLDKHRVREINQQLFLYFLEGMNNTPAYFMNDEDQSIEVEPYFKTCYELLEKRYPKSDAWKRTKPYWKALQASDQDAAENLLKDYTKKGWITDFEKGVEFYL